MKKSKLNRKLLRAVKNNACDQVDPLLIAGADPLANNCRAVYVAIARGRIQILEKFIRHGLDLNQVRIEPLSVAIDHNRLNVLAYLLSAGIGDAFAASYLAIECDFVEALSFLIESGAGVNAGLANYCATFDSILCLEHLVKRGFDPGQHQAMLVEACVGNSSCKVLKYMLEKYKVNIPHLNSLIIKASRQRHKGSIRALRMLIKAGATSPVECSKAFNAAACDRRTRSAKILLPHVNISEITGAALSELAYSLQFKFFKNVLKRGALKPDLKLENRAAMLVIEKIGPENFFVFNHGITLTSDFFKQRFRFCRKLAQAAYDFQRDESTLKAVLWLKRTVEIHP